jgi:hypothetical protein
MNDRDIEQYVNGNLKSAVIALYARVEELTEQLKRAEASLAVYDSDRTASYWKG